MIRKITDKKIAVIFGILTLLVYLFSYQGEGKHWNYFVLLADAFLQGRLNLIDHPDWLNELIFWQGKYYVVYPPMPAILLIPLVAIFGISFPQPLLSIFLGATNVSLSYLVFLKIFQKRQIALWISLLYAFGTMQWYHAEVGSAWYIAQIVALFFLWIALWEIFNKQRLFLIGLLIGFAYLSRLPAVLSIIFVLSYLHHKFIDISKKRLIVKNLFLLGFGIFPAILLNFLYNFLRFKVVYDISYTLLPIFNEPWYRYGLFSIRYIPIHLKEILTALPKFSSQSPFMIPSINVMALWFVTPAFLLILFAKFNQKIAWASLITLILMSLPSLMHGENGFTQFGFRFALDYLPFLLILTGLGLRDKLNYYKKALIVLSILINLWGVYMISFLDIWVL